MITRRDFLGMMGTLPLPGVVSMTGELKRVFHVVNIPEFATCHETHVETIGLVAYVKHEADGDLHIKLVSHASVTDGATDANPDEPFVVCEIIPELPIPLPRKVKVGDTLKVRGIRRFDDETAPGHQHWEIHPVTYAKILVSVSPL